MKNATVALVALRLRGYSISKCVQCGGWHVCQDGEPLFLGDDTDLYTSKWTALEAAVRAKL